MYDLTFWKLAAERAVKTAAQTTIAVLGAAQLDVFTADWRQAAGVGLGGAVLSLLTSIASEPIGIEGDPSVVR